MRLGTWNVEYARSVERNALRRAELLRHRADVWVLTETHDDLDPGQGFAAVRSSQRPAQPPGARWVTIWSRWPVLERPPVDDPQRTVAALLQAPYGQVVVFGTVLPWHSDRGDTPADPPPRNWEEHHRVIPQQGAEWARLRGAYPFADLCVIGDFNTGITAGYGTRQGRKLLADALTAAGLTCVTADTRGPDGQPLIDHVCLSGADRHAAVEVWGGDPDPRTARLSDHPGVLVAFD